MTDPGTKGATASAAFDVAVVGAGLAGSTAAFALASAGLRVASIDRAAPEARADAGFDGRTTAVAQGTKRILDTLDLWRDIAPAATPILDIRVAEKGSRLYVHYDHRDVGDEPLGYIVENSAIRAALAHRVAAMENIRVFSPATVVRCDRTESRGTLRLSTGETLDAALIVAADGKDSPLRAEAGLPVTRWRYDQSAIVCCVRHPLPHANVAVELFLPAGPFALLPMQGNMSSVVWTERNDAVPSIMKLDDARFVAEMHSRFGDWFGAFSLAGPRWVHPLGVTFAHQIASDRLALVGDAAHAIHPIAGQGINLGLRDVADLVEEVVDAWRLGLDIGHSSALVQYEKKRRADSLALLAATDGINRLFSNDILPLRIARNLGLGLVERLPVVKRALMRQAMGVAGGVAGGALSRLARGIPL